MNLDLKNKKVLITGASRGIGLAIAESFLQEKAKTLLVSRGSQSLLENKLRLQETYGKGAVLAAKCDCTNINSLEKLKIEIEKDWGSIDIVVANVGDGRSTPDIIPNNEDWQKSWITNFESALLTSRVFLPMLENSNGVLLFISSIAGLEVIGAPTDYSSAKMAIIALAKNIARKVAPAVRVNVIAPGNVCFEGGSWDEKIKLDKKNVDEIIKKNVPMNRFASPNEIADAAVFLCSEKAKFITGATLVIDGGQTTSY